VQHVDKVERKEERLVDASTQTTTPSPPAGDIGHCPPEIVRLVDVVTHCEARGGGEAHDRRVNQAVLDAWTVSLRSKYGDLQGPPPETLGIPLIKSGAARELVRAAAAQDKPLAPSASGRCSEALRTALHAKYGDLTAAAAPPEALGIPIIELCARQRLEAWAQKPEGRV